MSEDESFVILGSCSPGNSLEIEESLRSGFQSLEISKIEKDSAAGNSSETNAVTEHENLKSEPKSSIDEVNTISNVTLIESVSKKPMTKEDEENESVKDVTTSAKNKADNVTDCSVERSNASEKSNPDMNHSTNSRSTPNSSLAASFIMGEVDANVLKSNVYSQFPSLCSMESNAEEVNKLQNFMFEYLELKSTLAKVNATMKQFYEKTQQWREEMQNTELKYKQQLESFQTQIAKLRNENRELKHEMETKINQIAMAEELKKKDTTELIQLVSEKASLIENMRAQIEHLEKQNLASYEYLPRQEENTKDHTEYIARSEHLLAVKELERKLSALLAENLDLKDMQKVYIDEINCLKVNLTSAEELIQQSRRDIELLKSNDSENSKRFKEYETERNAMREDIAVLHQQVDVYFKDFQTERLARETLAGEKEQLLQDLRNLQRNNQQLIEAQQRRLESAVPTNSPNTNNQNTSTAHNGSSNTNTAEERLPPSNSTRHFNCPVCSRPFNSLTVLQSHVNSCLDKA